MVLSILLLADCRIVSGLLREVSLCEVLGLWLADGLFDLLLKALRASLKLGPSSTSEVSASLVPPAWLVKEE